jgi:hypothetical protein
MLPGHSDRRGAIPPKTGFPLRPERVLLLERLVRNELTLQRRLASGRRAASARMASIRQAPASLATLPLLDREAA